MAKRYYDNDSDGSMINTDPSAMANLPQNVLIMKYPRETGEMNETLDDTIKGIDKQKGQDNSKRNQHEQPEKY